MSAVTQGLLIGAAFSGMGLALGCLAWVYELKAQLRGERSRNERLYDELSLSTATPIRPARGGSHD